MLNTKILNTIFFKFFVHISGRGHNSKQRNFVLGLNFFPVIGSGLNWFLLG